MPRYRRRRTSQKRRTGGFNVGNFVNDLAKAVPTLVSVGQGIYNSYKRNKTSGMYRRRRRGPRSRRHTGGLVSALHKADNAFSKFFLGYPLH